MNKNKGFTLVELLSVVVILALTFMFVAPKMASLIKEGNNTEVRLIEQKALVSAKKYINNYDTNFLNNFIEVGYTKTVYKEDLIDNGLMTLDEISQIEDFRGVKVKLLENDKLEYTISRLSSTKDYTNEELYQMINELREQVSSNNTTLQNNINSLSTQVTNNNSNSNIFLKSYPVGSIYISTSGTNPGSTYGGTWVEYGKGRTLVGVNSSDSDFNKVEKIGGEKKHTLTIYEMPEHDHGQLITGYSEWGSKVISGYVLNFNSTVISNLGAVQTTLANTSTAYTNITSTGDDGAHNNLQPYITVYMWKRTA